MSRDKPAASSARQLPLNLPLDDEATFGNFWVDSSRAPVFAAVTAQPPPDGAEMEPLHYLHGGTAVGKTHLLQASCHVITGALYLPLRELAAMDPQALLSELEAAPRIALDDLDCVAGNAAWEEALFHLINRCRATGAQMLFAAAQAPAEIPVSLADLKSRLAGGVTWLLPGYSDHERREVLRFRAQRRGLRLSDAVLDYLGVRVRRSLDELLPLLERLDAASLQAQKPLTVPLVKEVLAP